jgi:hypothetical protein
MPKKRKKKVPIPKGIVFHPSYGPNRRAGAPIPFNDPAQDVSVPEIPFKLKMKTVVAKTRTLKMTHSLESAQELRDLYGLGNRRYIDVVERLTAIDKGLPDPGEWEELPSAEEQLVGAGAVEIEKEIDREIAKGVLEGLDRPPEAIDADIEKEIRFGLDQAAKGHAYHGLGEAVKKLLKEKDRVERARRSALPTRRASPTKASGGKRPRTATSRRAAASSGSRTRTKSPPSGPRPRRSSRSRS